MESFDELLVKSTQPDKLSNFMNRGGRRPTLNDLDLFGVDVYLIFIDDVSAKGYSTVEEGGFIDAGKQFLGGSSCRVKNNRKGRKTTGFGKHQMIIILMDMSGPPRTSTME